MKCDFDANSGVFRQDPYPTYSRLRKECPFFYSESQNGWVVSGNKEIGDILDDNRFDVVNRKNCEEGVGFLGKSVPTTDCIQKQAAGFKRRFIVNTSGNQHHYLRNLLQKCYSKKCTDEIIPHVALYAQRLLEQEERSGCFDAIKDYSMPIAHEATRRLMGIPESDMSSLLSCARTMLPKAHKGHEEINANLRSSAYMQLVTYFAKMCEAQLIGGATNAFWKVMIDECRERSVSIDTIAANVAMLFFVGTKGGAQLLAGTCLLRLLENPAFFNKATRSKEYLRMSIHETVRHSSPNQYVRRVATCDLTYRGLSIRQGDRLLLLIGSANRDERKYHHADVYEPDRGDRGHLGYGFGIRSCVAGGFVNSFVEAALCEYVIRYPASDLTEIVSFSWEDSFRVHGLSSLKIKIRKIKNY